MKTRNLLLSFFAGLLVCSSAFAQYKMRAKPAGNGLPYKSNTPIPVHLATGDTLLNITFTDIYVNPTDSGAFTLTSEDIDGQTPNSLYPSNWTDWSLYYSLEAEDIMPWDVDTAFYIAATSYFATPAQADNWLEFGPITIPSTGATLRWYAKCTSYGWDGYEVLLSTSGMANYTDFTSAPVYSRPDLVTSSNNPDSIFKQALTYVPASFAGQQVYFAFHHNANDVDVLSIDEILLTESMTGIQEAAGDLILAGQNSPNPFSKNTTVTYEISKPTVVTLEIADLTGRLLKVIQEEAPTPGIHSMNISSESLAEGMYFYTLKTDRSSITRRMIVSR